ncbi:hypothetical protein L1077_24755 [Pseudoalteromonas luteoviolacea]|uniref:hypothetical protein n=1 Tax=Pseudoalteromonas luteoviolacea TaxID=43657 RepID=UPI001F2F884B|nr:hypothetical protein [Pseudoalteromonas luteoviolacea]MCF6442637.1 hypothetical protein [Pseudoalteromonas luteoviolacea]
MKLVKLIGLCTGLCLSTSYVNAKPSETHTIKPAGYVSASAFGYSESNATQNVIAAWQKRAGSSKIPFYRCQYIGVGPGWQCRAWGYA